MITLYNPRLKYHFTFFDSNLSETEEALIAKLGLSGF